MSDSTEYEAIKLLAKAKHERRRGRFDTAIELLDQIIAFSETNRESMKQYPYREAHGELYKVYEAIGQDQLAFEYYKTALRLGVTPDHLEP